MIAASEFAGFRPAGFAFLRGLREHNDPAWFKPRKGVYEAEVLVPFRDLILARHTMNTAAMEAHNANYVGGDIGGGVVDWWQLFTRPVARLNPYTTPRPGLFICSSSTPPGGGVHGMCGYFAAQAALKRLK